MKIFSSITAFVATTLVALVLSPVNAQSRNVTAVIDIIGYNDVYEMLQDDVNGLKLGGPSRVIPLVKEMRAKNPNSLVIFAGDTMSPSLWSLQFKGMQMIDAHNAIGVDYACLGNHEFDFGVDAFLNVSQASNFKWLNANCYEYSTGQLLRGTQARAVKTLSDPQFGTIKIGFFGVMYDMKMPGERLYWTDPIVEAKRQVDLLRNKDKVDFVIALTHQELAADNVFSKEVKGVDLIYAGHDHAAQLQTNFGTPYLKADLDFRTIWRSHLEYFAPDAKNTAATTRMQHTLIPITESLPTDPDFEKTIAKYSETITQLQKQVVGTLCEPFDLQQKTVRTSDCAVGAVFADAAINMYGPNFADAAFINGGLIRSDKIYPAGQFTLGDVIAWSPFGNTLVVFETDGASVKKFLASQALLGCADGFAAPSGSYVQSGGIKYVFKCTGLQKGDLVSAEWFQHPTFTGPVQDTDVVKLTITNYILANNWAAVPGLNITKTLVSDAESIRIDAALEKFVKALPDANLCYKAQGRSLVSF